MSGNISSHEATGNDPADSSAHARPGIYFDTRNTSFVGRDFGSHNISAHAGGNQIIAVNQSDPADDIILWLRTDTAYLASHDSVFKLRVEGTGQWFFDSPEYERWDKREGEENRYLECRGMPGAGKTSLASAAIEYFRKRASSGTLVLFVYFRHDTQDSQTVEKVLASLLSQVVQEKGSVSKDVSRLYSMYRHHRNAFPPAQKIVEILRLEIAAFKQTYLIVDALDEYCIANNDKSHQLIMELCHLKVKMLVTSRYQVEFPTAALQLKISAHEDDVQALIDECIAKTLRLQRFIAETPGLRDTIIQKVTANAKGMILVVRLHMDSLSDLMTAGDVLDALDQLPADLDVAYERAVEQILLKQSEKKAAVAMETISWLLHGERPLEVLELRHAVSFKAGMKLIDKTRLWQIDDIIAACLALVVVVGSRSQRFCQFVHFSTKEFFERNRERYFPDAQRQITEKCLEYSIAAIAQSERDVASDLTKHIRSKFPLCVYTTTYWGSHGYNAKNSFQKHHLVFSLYTQSISPYVADYYITGIWPLENKMPPHHYTLLYLSRYGLITAIELCCKGNMFSIDDVRDVLGRTPLHLASWHDHRDTVNLLLKIGAGLNVRDKVDETPLNLASSRGHLAVVELLLEKGVDLSISNTKGFTPVHHAAAGGHLAVMQLLLGKGADSNAQDKDGDTPLHIASLEGYPGMVELLLEKGVDQRILNNDCSTPVHLAAARGHLVVVHLLLNMGGDPNAQKKDGNTPLTLASQEGHATVVKSLLEKGGDPNTSNSSGSTPLHLAAERGHLAVVELCLNKGVNPNAQDENGDTPLTLASWKGHPAVVELLLEKGVDPSIPDTNGLTPLHLAAKEGHLAIVLLLLDNGADLNTQNKRGNTPLTLASQEGHTTVVEVLLEKGGDPNTSNNSGSTPLHLAAERGHLAVVELCLNKGVDPNAQDEDGDTPLNLASWKGHPAVVELLLEKGVDPSISDTNGLTPLHLAAKEGYLAVVQLCLDKGADPNAQDQDGDTPLILASQEGHITVVELLHYHGADQRISDWFYTSPPRC